MTGYTFPNRHSESGGKLFLRGPESGDESSRLTSKKKKKNNNTHEYKSKQKPDHVGFMPLDLLIIFTFRAQKVFTK